MATKNNVVNNSLQSLSMPTTTALGDGIININSVPFVSFYGTENIFIGGAGNFTLNTGSAVGNIGIGNSAFSILSTGTNNTVVGTSSGGNILDGTLNCVFGAAAAPAMISGTQNTVIGASCGGAVGNSGGSFNNIIIGWGSGGQLAGTEAGNIYLGNPGVASESGAIRIGKVTGGAGFTAQTTCCIAGIYGNTPSGTAQVVYVDTDGTMSAAAGGGGAASKTTLFPVVGGVTTTATWTKDASTKFVTVIGFGGGAGGGSGRQGLAGDSGGGAGGGGACAFIIQSPAAFYGATETVVTGVGGAGGAAQTTDMTDGNNGADGDATSFGSYVTTYTTTGGQGGTDGESSGGSPSVMQSFIYYYKQAVDPLGGDGKNTDGTSATPAAISDAICGLGGGGGGGADAAVARSGGFGGNLLDLNGAGTINGGGVGGIQTGTIDGGNGNDWLQNGGNVSGGTGGGGGGGTVGVSGVGAGGNGGFPGGGGGGGGGSLTGTTSGAGGKGGDGIVMVIEYF